MRIAVMTCDKNTYVLPVFWHFIEKYWADCCWPVDIVGGPKLFELLRPWKTPCRMIQMPDDSCWSDMLIGYLEHCCDTEFLLIFLEDLILAGYVDTKRVQACLNVIKADPDVMFMRLSACPPPTLPWLPKLGIGEIDRTIPPLSYLSSVLPTIWRVEHLRRLLKSGESVWDLEIAGSERARALPGIYLGSEKGVIGCMNFLLRGRVSEKAVKEVGEKW